MKRGLYILLLLLISACSGSKSFLVSGKVARDKKTLANVDVYAYKAKSLLNFSQPDATTNSNGKGTYNLVVPEEGDYYITAETVKSGSDEVDLYAFYGRNPLYVTESGVTNINLNMQRIKSEVSFEKSEQPGIKCILTSHGEPLDGAIVFVALDLNEGMQTKGFTQSTITGDNGVGFIPVDTGTYYLTARKRMSTMFGPLAKGDLIGFYHKNPIVVSEAGTYTVHIELLEIPEKSGSDVENATKTVITGKVIDENGEPVEGIWVGAYKDPQMFGKPIIISPKSDANGEFTLVLAKPGKYYLAARDMLGGPPNPGELYGSYSGTDDHSVTLEAGGKISGIEITVREMW
jgi:hypothetical protein